METKEVKATKETTLVIMAAGIGSRFGKGVKQLTPVGPSGELIMDYSVNDALEAGFNKVVFILRREILDEFHNTIGKRIEKKIEVNYVFQELEDLPEGFEKPADRTKPWGTGQAVLCCRNAVTTPFAVINADDYYGKEPYRLLHDYLVQEHAVTNGVQPVCMAGFRLGNTLSENGGVTRGLCEVDAQNHLVAIHETKNIRKTPEGAEANGRTLSADMPVSMNMWGFQREFIDLLEDGFTQFLRQQPAGDITGEFLLPIFVDELLKTNRAQVQVMETMEKWFGVTYQEDREAVTAAFRKLAQEGVYKTNLYED